MKRVGLWAIGIGLFITVGLITVKQGHPKQEEHEIQCTLATLNGLYVFVLNGYNITTSGGLLPKAIAEFRDFNGDGTVTSLTTRSLNGVISRFTGSGTYTVADKTCTGAGCQCTGTITVNPGPNAGPHFDIFIAPNGEEYYQIQTDPNTVEAGVSRRVSRE